jgi:hypothetical protein
MAAPREVLRFGWKVLVTPSNRLREVIGLDKLVLAREYQLTLPQEQQLTQSLEKWRGQLESRGAVAKQLPVNPSIGGFVA